MWKEKRCFPYPEVGETKGLLVVESGSLGSRLRVQLRARFPMRPQPSIQNKLVNKGLCKAENKDSF